MEFRVGYYLNKIEPLKYKLADKFKTGKLHLNYRLEFVGSSVKLHIDLKDHEYSSLRDIPREELVVEEKIFLTFLANVPCNNGYFYFNQRNLSKLFFFLKDIKNVYDFNSGEKLKIPDEAFDIRLDLKNKADHYQLSLKHKNKEINFTKLIIHGDKEYIVVYDEKYYCMSEFKYYLLSLFLDNSLIEFPKERVAEFISGYKDLFIENMIDLKLPGEASKVEGNLIREKPTPVLEIKKEGEQLYINYLLKYGNKAEIAYDPENIDQFYIKKINGENIHFQRDMVSEEWLHDFLLENRFVWDQNSYKIDQDDLVDFYTYQFPGLKKNIGLTMTGEDLKQYFYEDDSSFNVDLDFHEASGIDWFEFQPKYKVGKQTFTHEELRAYIDEDKTYLRLNNGKIVKLPFGDYEKIESLVEHEKFDNKKKAYQIKKRELYFFYSTVRNELKAQVDRSIKKLLENLDDFSGIELIALPADLQGKPRKYQRDGYYWLNFLFKNQFHGILADDMGLGKTLQVLLLLSYLKENGLKTKPSLVVAPTSVVYNWVAEIKKFTTNLNYLVLAGSKERILKVKDIDKYDIVITSYALVRNDLVHYQEIEFFYLILDEAQYIKNHKAKITQSIKCLRSEYRLAMTGTPVENRLAELWSVFDFLMPGFLSTYNYFRMMFEGDIEKLKNKIKPFIMRRLKVDVLDDLPPKNVIFSYNELLPEQEKVYLSVLAAQKKDLFNKIKQDGYAKSQMNILTALLKLRQVCCHPVLVQKENVTAGSAKFDQLKELVNEIIEDGHKVIVFSQFVQMLKEVKEYFDQSYIIYSYLDGSTRNRQKAIDDFNNDEDISVFLCSLKAGGFGLNLTAANYVIIYDPWWNPAVEQQAMDRVYRIGQSKEVFVYKLITKGTVEEKIIKLQEKKQKLVESVITKEAAVSKSVSQEDLEELLNY